MGGATEIWTTGWWRWVLKPSDWFQCFTFLIHFFDNVNFMLLAFLVSLPPFLVLPTGSNQQPVVQRQSSHWGSLVPDVLGNAGLLCVFHFLFWGFPFKHLQTWGLTSPSTESSHLAGCCLAIHSTQPEKSAALDADGVTNACNGVMLHSGLKREREARWTGWKSRVYDDVLWWRKKIAAQPLALRFYFERVPSISSSYWLLTSSLTVSRSPCRRTLKWSHSHLIYSQLVSVWSHWANWPLVKQQ